MDYGRCCDWKREITEENTGGAENYLVFAENGSDYTGAKRVAGREGVRAEKTGGDECNWSLSELCAPGNGWLRMCNDRVCRVRPSEYETGTEKKGAECLVWKRWNQCILCTGAD